MARSEPTSLLPLIEDHCRRVPQRAAITDLSAEPAWQVGYSELDALATRAARGLIAHGVHQGEPVAYQIPNGWEFVVLTIAIWRAGAIPCPLLPSLRERELRFILDSSGAQMLIVPDRHRDVDHVALAGRVQTLLGRPVQLIVIRQDDRDPHRSALGGLLPGGDGVHNPLPVVASTDVAQLLYTSGTTGEPKGVQHTHASLWQALRSHARTLGLTSRDTVWIPSPAAHQTGFLYGMMVALFLGATAVIQDRWDVLTAKRAIEHHGARFVQAAMPFLTDIAELDEPPQGLRLFIATGAPVPQPLALRARTALGCTVVGAWGSTESCLVTVGRPDDSVDKLCATDGRAIDGMEVRIVADDGRTLPAGVEGNFQVRTPAIFLGYLHRPDLTAQAMTADGYFDTGDLAVLDADGYIRITGRKKDVINRGGEKIPVVEIENLLYRHPAIADIAVVGIPDARLGERACACIVTRPGTTPPSLADVTHFLAQAGMAKIYWPERIETLPELPRTATGKVQKYALRQMLAARLETAAGP